MKLTVIGCWAAYPQAGESCSGYLITEGDTAVLVDCGHGVMSRLPFYFAPERLSAVLISHYHPDHVGDLEALRHKWRAMTFLGQGKGPLLVVAPPGLPETRKLKGRPEIRVEEMADGFRVGGLEFTFYAANHTIPANMIKVKSDSQTIFYTGDTSYFPGGIAASAGVDLLLAEATLDNMAQATAADLGHMTWNDCIRWAMESGCKQLMATHFWPEYDLREIDDTISAGYKGRFLLAREGLTVDLGEIDA